MPYSSMLLHVNLDSLAARTEDLSRRFFREDSTLISIFDQFRFSLVFFLGLLKIGPNCYT